VEVALASQAPAEVDADLLCIGLFEGDELPAPFADAAGAADAKPAYKRTALLRPGSPERVLVVGLGPRADFSPERARVAAAIASRQAASLEAGRVAWVPPDEGDDADVAAALVEGTELATYRFDRYKGSDGDDEPRPRIESLALVGVSEPAGEAARVALVAARAANRARELQNLPANVVTPSYLADRAREIASAHERVSAEVMDRAEVEKLGMGGLVGVARGTDEEPRLIVLRHEGPGETLGLVGKAVTFDSGGISIKPSSRMHEMKMDMSGGAAVIEAVSAIAELELDLSVLAIVPATENMPSGHALKPGDVITQHNGKTVEIINTDAEGRLILADALSWCAEQGADRIVDLATLTGAVLTALGSTYAGLVSNDDEWAARVLAAGEASGELAWRLPLHEEYKALTRGSITDLVNASEKRKASTIYAASFLEEFVDSKPWVHLDIAGTAWDVGREYVGKGATGFGVRLLVELAREVVRGRARRRVR
jgi:leucyl aminopeptidase